MSDSKFQFFLEHVFSLKHLIKSLFGLEPYNVICVWVIFISIIIYFLFFIAFYLFLYQILCNFLFSSIVVKTMDYVDAKINSKLSFKLDYFRDLFTGYSFLIEKNSFKRIETLEDFLDSLLFLFKILFGFFYFTIIDIFIFSSLNIHFAKYAYIYFCSFLFLFYIFLAYCLIKEIVMDFDDLPFFKKIYLKHEKTFFSFNCFFFMLFIIELILLGLLFRSEDIYNIIGIYQIGPTPDEVLLIEFLEKYVPDYEELLEEIKKKKKK